MKILSRLMQSVVRTVTDQVAPLRTERRLCVVFRPLVNLCDGSLRGFEALVRTSTNEEINRTDDLLKELAQVLEVKAQAVQRERYVWSGQRLERAAFEVEQGAQLWSELVLRMHAFCQAYGLRCVSAAQNTPAPQSPTPLQTQFLVFGR